MVILLSMQSRLLRATSAFKTSRSSYRKDQEATSGNPYVGPLAARNRNRSRFHSPHSFDHGQFPAATGLTTERKCSGGKEKCLYTSRHTFVKRTLSGYYTGKPVSIEVLAGLLGNTPAVAWRHYARWADAYNDPLWEALGKKKPKKKVG